VLAGIPTIVYGLFALITVGPMLRDWFAQPLGLGTSGSSVMTAGLVMGVMLIPFVSSLSDDIINAVPQSCATARWGWARPLGNHPQGGAARRPAGHRRRHPAGRQPRHRRDDDRGPGRRRHGPMGLNPFEAMTTITVKIVSQLTGDTDFAAPKRWSPLPLA
jgi:phosphate transport system permease protein